MGSDNSFFHMILPKKIYYLTFNFLTENLETEYWLNDLNAEHNYMIR